MFRNNMQKHSQFDWKVFFCFCEFLNLADDSKEKIENVHPFSCKSLFPKYSYCEVDGVWYGKNSILHKYKIMPHQLNILCSRNLSFSASVSCCTHDSLGLLWYGKPGVCCQQTFRVCLLMACQHSAVPVVAGQPQT